MLEECKVYWCPRGCRMVYQTDGLVGFNTVCERCKQNLTWARSPTIEGVERLIGIPYSEWYDLTEDTMNVHAERVIKSLQSGCVTGHTGFGNSMLPVIKSGQKQTLIPVLSHEEAKTLGCKPFDPKEDYKIGDKYYIHPDQLAEEMPASIDFQLLISASNARLHPLP